MALRILDLIIPVGKEGELDQLLEDGDVVDRWRIDARGQKVCARLLVRREKTEALLDKLELRFGHMPGFRIVLAAVDVTLPKVEETQPPEPSGGAEDSENRVLFGRVSRHELQNTMDKATRQTAEFFVMVVLASVVAAVGLLNNAPAVVIAAMVIAPLLGPNMALALATTTGDVGLARRATRLNLEGIALALGLSLLFGLVFRDHQGLALPEVQNRTVVTFGDFALAIASGIAGTLSFTTGASGTLIGVMVAVALLPPSIVLGLMAGAGNWAAAGGAATLLATNVVCINLAGVLTFFALGVRPSRWWMQQSARRATWRAVAIWTALLVVALGAALLFRSLTPAR